MFIYCVSPFVCSARCYEFLSIAQNCFRGNWILMYGNVFTCELTSYATAVILSLKTDRKQRYLFVMKGLVLLVLFLHYQHFL